MSEHDKNHEYEESDVNLGSISDGAMNFDDPFGDNPFLDDDSDDDDDNAANSIEDDSDESSISNMVEEDSDDKAEEKSESKPNSLFDDDDLSSEELQKQLSDKKLSSPSKKSAPKAESNPLEAAINDTLMKEMEQNIFTKLPVFSFEGIEEEIEDTSITFEGLRKEKKVDFPALEDAGKVSWRMDYGACSESIVAPSKKTLSEVKESIEKSEKFLSGIKKAKKPEDKSPVCKVIPRVVAKSKGNEVMPGYKGVFISLEEANKANKAISILPARNGQVMEIRKLPIGVFITPKVNGDPVLSDIKQGFQPTLPKIPSELFGEIMEHFKLAANKQKELLITIFWDSLEGKFIYDIPFQATTKASIYAEPSAEYDDTSRYFEYMDIHSHNTMEAFFSSIDNADEKGTKLYAVVGKVLDEIPQMRVRIANNGAFVDIKADEVFESIHVKDRLLETAENNHKDLPKSKNILSCFLSLMSGEYNEI